MTSILHWPRAPRSARRQLLASTSLRPVLPLRPRLPRRWQKRGR